MSAEITKLETVPERRWREFCEARERALSSLDIKDAAAAGRAWARFLSVYAERNGATQ
ncbi:hypothetical protein ACE10X_13105 [Bradyrhizobium sp. Pha-3]|uniref:hypothetical protein n=1 Tax=Bradyrhizobium sp. Pha-3 TaxID=208375 RepID=UPI0035D4B511